MQLVAAIHGALVGASNVVTDQATLTHALGDTLNLTRRHKLSADAYLELALCTGLPQATLDANLANAATTVGVQVVGTR